MIKKGPEAVQLRFCVYTCTGYDNIIIRKEGQHFSLDQLSYRCTDLCSGYRFG